MDNSSLRAGFVAFYDTRVSFKLPGLGMAVLCVLELVYFFWHYHILSHSILL